MSFSKSSIAVAAAALCGAAPLAYPQSAGYTGTPYSGSAPSVPTVIPAVNFDNGGQGVAYNDLSAGNLGRQYRNRDGVDIYATAERTFGNYQVRNFQTGEWLNYTINVPATGYYDLGVRASNGNAASAALRIQIDGQDVTGSVPVTNTGSWDTYQWFGKNAIRLTAGRHVVRLFSEQQWFDVTALSIQASSNAPAPTPGSGPYSGTPIAAPATFPAVNFDKGGEGLGYHDLSAGNLGGQFRAGEGVDIYPSTDATGGGYKVANFQTGEWMAYTVNVPTSGNYELAVRASNNLATGVSGAFRLEVDGRDVTGSVAVPVTGSWDTYQWFGKTVALTAGTHLVKLVSLQQWFDVSALRVQASAAGADTTAPSAPGGVRASGVTSTGATLAWNASTDNVGVAGYRVYRSGTLVATATGTATSATVTGLSPSTAYSFTVAAFDAAGNVSASSAPLSVTTTAAAAPALPPLWSAGMEAGNMLEWYSAGGGMEHNGSNYFVQGNGTTRTTGPDGEYSEASRERARTGSWSAKLALTSSQGGVRLWRWKEPGENRELYYSAWYFFPQRYTVNSGGWNNILQYKSSTPDGKNDPFFLIGWTNEGTNGAMRAGLHWWQPSFEGPQRGQSGKRTYMFPADIPTGRWVNIEVRHSCSGDFTGTVQVWQDGVEMIKLDNVRTAYPGGNCLWAITNYAQNIGPLPYYYYVDDVAISRTRINP